MNISQSCVGFLTPGLPYTQVSPENTLYYELHLLRNLEKCMSWMITWSAALCLWERPSSKLLYVRLKMEITFLFCPWDIDQTILSEERFLCHTFLWSHWILCCWACVSSGSEKMPHYALLNCSVYRFLVLHPWHLLIIVYKDKKGLLVHCSNRFHVLFLCSFGGLFFDLFIFLKDQIYLLYNFQDLVLFVVSKALFSPLNEEKDLYYWETSNQKRGDISIPFRNRNYKYDLQQLRYNALFTNSKCTHFYADLTIVTQFLFAFCHITSINK